MTADEVYTKLTEVIDNWHTFIDQHREWIGGPDSDSDTNETDKGKRLLSDHTGSSALVDTPAELERRVTDAIAGLGLQEDLATFEARVNQTVADMQALKAEIDAALVDVDTAEPLAQQALDSANAAQAQVDSIITELTDLKNAALLSEKNALSFATQASMERMKAQKIKDDFERLIWYGI